MKEKLLLKKTIWLRSLLFYAVFAVCGFSYAQNVTVTGTVSGTDGPLPGANVIVKGTTAGTSTDFDGMYTLDNLSPDAVLIFSSLGFITQEIAIEDRNVIDVTLVADAQSLDEIVIVGYGKSVRKEDLTGAVSVVGVKDMEKSPLTSVDQALQGRASGVSITQSSGAPGAGFKIRIRGSNSITGNNSPLVVVDGLIDVDINSVNPNDIQSISVLKDASASAIYGNRAANGVIIITTKKGTSGKAIIEFGTFVSFSDPSDEIDLLSPSEFIDYANVKSFATSGSVVPQLDTQAKIDDFVANSVNYQDEVYRTAVAQNYQISFRGGSENMNYYVSGNYLDQEGLAINTNFRRYALRSNINADLSDKLKLSTSINLIRQEGLNNSADFGAGLALGAVGFYPITPIFNDTGAYNKQNVELAGGIATLINPIFLANESIGEGVTNRVQANVQLNYNLVKNLDVNLSGGIDYGNTSVGFFNPTGSTLGQPNNAGQNTTNGTNWQYALRFTYDNTFNEKHNVTASAIFEQRKSKSTGFGANGTNFFTESTGFDNLGLADVQTINSFYNERMLRSAIGRATYNYDSRYIVTASVRYDQSSVFVNDQDAVFPSFALGWNINNEDFFNSESISTLRLRAGWGKTGNEQIGTNDALNLLRNNPWIPNGGDVGSTAILPGSRLANPDLSWETTIQTNIGVDLGILNDRYNLSLEYYIKNTEDLLLTKNVAQYTGRVDQVINAGEVENKGFDVTLSGKIFQKENFSWDLSANFSANTNEVIDLVGDETEIFPSLVVGGSIPTPTIVRIGEPIGSFYGYVYEGVNEADGNAVYAEERDLIGDPNPDFTYGINNNLTYKNFDLNVFIQGVQGNEIFNYARGLILGRDGRIPYGTSAEIRNTWSPANTSASLPSLSANNTQALSSEFIEDGSFLRLKNISLGYTFSDVSALESAGISSLKLYVSGQNLFTITDYSGLDPEVSNGGQNDGLAGIDIGALPTSKTVTLGLNLKF